MPGLRVVLDTNVLVSGLAYPASFSGRIVGAWKRGSLNLVLSRYILDGLARVLPRLSRIALNQDEMGDLVDSFLFLAEIVEPAPIAEKNLRDAADTPILGTLLAAKADYLITGDKNLLALAHQYSIVTPAAFWQRHGE